MNIQKYSKKCIEALLALCFFATVTMGTYWIFLRYVFPHKRVRVFVEMKVIDAEGHPVAGADILVKEQRIGVTDAFGEWSQFVDANLGSSVSFMIKKKIGKTTLRTVKDLSIPSTVMIDDGGRLKINIPLASSL